MALDTLKFGIWLTNHNFMKYAPVEGKAVLTGYGSAPVMVIKNTASMAGFSTQTGTGSTSVEPRMVAGFDQLQLSLVDYTTPYSMGNINTEGFPEIATAEIPVISPNPVHEKLNVTMNNRNFYWEILDMSSHLQFSGRSDSESIQMNVSALKPGVYLFKTQNINTTNYSCTKFIKY
jgi:hypothetical protein